MKDKNILRKRMTRVSPAAGYAGRCCILDCDKKAKYKNMEGYGTSFGGNASKYFYYCRNHAKQHESFDTMKRLTKDDE
jgi:hypothetical protein